MKPSEPDDWTKRDYYDEDDEEWDAEGWAAAERAAQAEREPETGTRLQKVLAHAGVASRRACEALISSGRVSVNGAVVREQGRRIDPEHDEVRVDGVIVQLDVSKRYFVLNKPRGVVSTMSDERGRPDLREFTDPVGERLYNVGRLDTDTSGLLILTNDGELAHRLAHPSFGVQKTYIAKVTGRVTAQTVQQLKNGITLDDGPIHADAAKILPGGSGSRSSLIEVTLHSGRNRIVRRMLAAVGHPVEELVRRSFGPLNLGTLKLGEMRELSGAERGALLTAAEGDEPQSAPGGSASRRPVTAGRPGDGKGAHGMRGIAAKGNPHGRGGPKGDTRGDAKSSGKQAGAAPASKSGAKNARAKKTGGAPAARNHTDTSRASRTPRARKERG